MHVARFAKRKKKKKNLLSSSPRTFTCVMRTRGACFRFRKYLNARDRYRAASYETSCSRIYVCPTRTRRLSVVLFKRSGEKRKRYISYRRSNTGLSVVGVDPRATRFNLPPAFKIRTEEERSFRASHRRLCRRGRSARYLKNESD